MPDVKLMQVQFMLDEIQKVYQLHNETFPLFIAGDFNSEPSSGVFELLKNGFVSSDHVDWKNINYGKYSVEGGSHKLKLSNCFTPCQEQPTFTIYSGDFLGILDYIWYSEDNIRPLGVLLPPTEKDIMLQKSPLPNIHYPSDHIFLLSEFEVLYPSSNNKKQRNYH